MDSIVILHYYYIIKHTGLNGRHRGGEEGVGEWKENGERVIIV